MTLHLDTHPQAIEPTTAFNPGTAGFEELVPSRYALRVGEIDVLVVSDGVLPLPTATMATNADPADLARWLQYMFMPPDAFDWPLNVMVARSGDQTILIDAGLGGQFPGFPRAGQLPQRLEDAGIALTTLFAPNGWFGAPLMDAGIRVADCGAAQRSPGAGQGPWRGDQHSGRRSPPPAGPAPCRGYVPPVRPATEIRAGSAAGCRWPVVPVCADAGPRRIPASA